VWRPGVQTRRQNAKRDAVRTLAHALQPIAAEIAGAPRVYADANIPAGVVSIMRHELGWDVLFVLEHDDLRRAPDREHFQFARDLGRTLVTLDRDFSDERRFPHAESPGVIICSAPDETALVRLLRSVDRTLLRVEGSAAPLRGRVIEMTCPDPL
jgi:predicted nuclease of predicted toxin-antitoxin system